MRGLFFPARIFLLIVVFVISEILVEYCGPHLSKFFSIHFFQRFLDESRMIELSMLYQLRVATFQIVVEDIRRWVC